MTDDGVEDLLDQPFDADKDEAEKKKFSSKKKGRKSTNKTEKSVEDGFFEARDRTYEILGIAGGFNDDTVAGLYNQRYRDTIGAMLTQDHYNILVYRGGVYNEKSVKEVDERLTSILAELCDIAETAKNENRDRDGEVINEGVEETANAMRKFASGRRNGGARTSILRRLAVTNLHTLEELDRSDTIIGLPNGALLIDYTARTVTHDPEYHPEALNRMVAGMPYDDNAEVPGEWLEWVEDKLSYTVDHTRRTGPEEAAKISAEARLLRGMAGWLFLRGNREQLIIEWLGSTGSGKGTLMDILSGVMGSYALHSRKELVISQPPGKIMSDVGVAVTKHAVFVDEFNSVDSIDTGRLRFLTNKKIMVEVKHVNPYEADNNMKLVVITNYDNRFDNPDDTIMRRLVILRFFKPPVTGTDFDPDIAPKMLTKMGPGIFKWVIEGMRDVLQSGGLKNIVPAHVDAAMRDQVRMQDRSAVFLAKYLPQTKKANDVVLLQDSFKDMFDWFENVREKPPAKTSNAWSAILRNHGYDVYTGHGVAKIRGCIRLPIVRIETIETERPLELPEKASDEQGQRLIEPEYCRYEDADEAERRADVRQVLRKECKARSGNHVPFQFIRETLEPYGYSADYIGSVLDSMKKNGEIMELPGAPGQYVWAGD